MSERVYIATEGTNDSSDILGAYRTEEGAKAAAEDAHRQQVKRNNERELRLAGVVKRAPEHIEYAPLEWRPMPEILGQGIEAAGCIIYHYNVQPYEVQP